MLSLHMIYLFRNSLLQEHSNLLAWWFRVQSAACTQPMDATVSSLGIFHIPHRTTFKLTAEFVILEQ